jgi:hypothetical protein
MMTGGKLIIAKADPDRSVGYTLVRKIICHRFKVRHGSIFSPALPNATLDAPTPLQ